MGASDTPIVQMSTVLLCSCRTGGGGGGGGGGRDYSAMGVDESTMTTVVLSTQIETGDKPRCFSYCIPHHGAPIITRSMRSPIFYPPTISADALPTFNKHHLFQKRTRSARTLLVRHRKEKKGSGGGGMMWWLPNLSQYPSQPWRRQRLSGTQRQFHMANCPWPHADRDSLLSGTRGARPDTHHRLEAGSLSLATIPGIQW